MLRKSEMNCGKKQITTLEKAFKRQQRRQQQQQPQQQQQRQRQRQRQQQQRTTEPKFSS